MKEFVQQIDIGSGIALEKCVGRTIQSVLAPSCDLHIGHAVVTTQSISIRIGVREFLVIENDWADTPVERHDYYILNVSISDRPKNINVREQKSAPCWSYLMDHFCLRLGAQACIQEVSLLEDSCSGQEEAVRYDAGLKFVLSNNLCFSIVREESISGFLVLSHSIDEVAEALSGLQTRSKFEARA